MTMSIRGFKGTKHIYTELGDVPVTVYYKYDEAWEDYEITSILTSEGSELVKMLDVVTETTYHNLITEIYKIEEEYE